MSTYNNAGRHFDPALSVKEIAKRLRQTIRTMQERGLFSDMQVSVRIRPYSMGCSLNVEIRQWNGPIYNPEFVQANERGRDTADIPTYHERADQVLRVLRILGDQWNYNNSDGMIDYYETNYALDVRFEGEMANQDYARAKAA